MDVEDVLSSGGSNSNSSTDDSSHPFFLHHSDPPGLLLVSKRLNGDNYTSWCRSMRISLSAKNKTGFITEKIKEPSTDSDDHPLWQRCNDMVLSWIHNSLEPEIPDSVLSCATPRAVWEDLRERFSLGNAPHQFQIQRDIYRIEQGHSSVAAYYTKLKALWDELSSFSSMTCTCGNNDRTKLMQFLMGLNESFSGTRGQILLMNPLPSVRHAYAYVVQEEKQRELASNIIAPSDTAAMAVRIGNNNVFRSRENNSVIQRNNNKNREPFKCTYCGIDYHREATCWKKNGYPPGHPKHKPKQRQGSNGGPTSSAPTLSANHVDSTPTFQELQVLMPNLTQEQYAQIVTTMNTKSDSPQANAASGSVYEFSKGLGYKDDDWCG